jgi:hypothetical protein
MNLVDAANIFGGGGGKPKPGSPQSAAKKILEKKKKGKVVYLNDFMSVALGAATITDKGDKLRFQQRGDVHEKIGRLFWPLYREMVTTVSILKSMITQFDDSKSGSLDPKGMFKLVHFVSPHNPLTQDEINAFITHMDDDGSGTIESTEFVSFVVDALYRSPSESDAYADQSEVHAKLQAFLDLLLVQVSNTTAGRAGGFGKQNSNNKKRPGMITRGKSLFKISPEEREKNGPGLVGAPRQVCRAAAGRSPCARRTRQPPAA